MLNETFSVIFKHRTIAKMALIQIIAEIRVNYNLSLALNLATYARP